MMKKILIEIIVLFTICSIALGQKGKTKTPVDDEKSAPTTLTPEQIQQLRTGTAFETEKEASSESSALSYGALGELSSRMAQVMRPNISQYSTIIIYNEPDFLALAKYRIYRNESAVALKNYDAFVGKVASLNKERIADNTTASRGGQDLSTFFSLPNIAATSIAGLLSVFRSDTTITESHDIVDNDALVSAMANELQKADPNLKIYYPQAFVPEYDLESEGQDSLIMQIAKINDANASLGDFFAQCDKIPEAQRSQPLLETVALGTTLKRQLQALAIGDVPEAAPNARGGPASDSAQSNLTELHSLIRAEKLDRFLRPAGNARGAFTQGRVGIIKMRVLASGGSRREIRNLLLGNKISYSGSATIEVMLFDVDGLLRESQILSLHTGFQKMNTSDRDPLKK